MGIGQGQSEYLRSNPRIHQSRTQRQFTATNQLNFDAQVLQSKLPVLDEVAEEYHERLRVVKVNVEQEPQIAL